MTEYAEMSRDELRKLRDELEFEYQGYLTAGLDLNMARGKPGDEQLDLSRPMLDIVNAKSDLVAEDGTDCRNYGVLAGIPEARRLMGELVGARPEQVIVCGSSSLNIMYDTVSRSFSHGIAGQDPWYRQAERGPLKWLCPAPGYDRHFRITERFGIEMTPIEMTEDGPDMGTVRELVEGDPAVKGIWCVPKYSNPQGYSYSDETVRAFAALEPAAPDFRIYWDNAYCVHHLYDEPERQDTVLDILAECEKAGHPDLAFEFCSTSKVTFPGAGVSAFVSSEANVAEALDAMGPQVIGYDKLNQLRHVRFLRDAEGVAAHMRKQAAFLRPRFEAVWRIFGEDLGGTGIATWTRPNGGYFISYVGLEGTAREVVKRAERAGVKLTAAGATWPYGKDPHDADIRIAPSFPALEDLEKAARVFTVCARLVSIEKLLAS